MKEIKTASNNLFVLGVDRVVDFATLGEYRVVTGSHERQVEERNIWAQHDWPQNNWAADIDWSSASARADRQPSTCSLPRARDRKLARERVRG